MYWSNPKRMIILTTILLIIQTPITLFGAEITVPRMDLFTRGLWDEGKLILRSSGDIGIKIEGGVKLAGELGFRFKASHLEEVFSDQIGSSLSSSLEFKNARVTINDIFNIPVNLSYFVGETDILCDGSTFTDLFGSDNFTTQYAGHLYFPDEPIYEGLSKISGTGISLSALPGQTNMRFLAYTFQDNYLGEGKFSSAARFLLNLKNLKLEAYLKGSYPDGKFGTYGAGLMIFFRPAEMGEFFTQIGIPHWDGGTFKTDLIYFLFEPRVRLDLLSINMTFLVRPGYYLGKNTNQEGDMDINVNFQIGKPEVSPISGGLESTLILNTKSSSEANKKFFNFSLSPHFGALTSGIIWKFKVKYNILKNDGDPLFEGYIGVKAVL